jgi:hypothetical protein
MVLSETNELIQRIPNRKLYVGPDPQARWIWACRWDTFSAQVANPGLGLTLPDPFFRLKDSEILQD